MQLFPDFEVRIKERNQNLGQYRYKEVKLYNQTEVLHNVFPHANYFVN